MTQHAVTHYGSIVTQTFGVTIATISVTRSDVHDIIADLEDEIVDKAVAKYQRSQHLSKGGWDQETYTFYIADDGDTHRKHKEYHAYTTGVRARDRIGEVLVTVFGMTQRM